MKKQTPTQTKAVDHEPEGKGTKLAQVDPAKVTNAEIKEITGDDGTDEPENSANQDAAETMKRDRAEAKSADEPERGYFHGQGGAAGV